MRVVHGELVETIVIAHRGASETAPENTLVAFEEAILLGVQMFELDTHETLDNHLVCIHDYDVSRTTNGEGLVSEMTLSELLQLDAGRGQRVPLLKEALELAKGRALVNIELKVPGIESAVVQLLSELGMTTDVIVSSFFHEALVDIVKESKSIKTAVLFSHDLEDPVSYALGLSANAINPHHELLDPDMVLNAKKRGLEVYPWTVNERSRMIELVRMGISGIITDRSALCLDVVKRARLDADFG